MKEPKIFVEKNYKNIIKDLKTIALIAAPPFKEKRRISYIKDYLIRKGFCGINIDKEGNLFLGLNKEKSRTILFSAHVDTVFPESTELKIKEDKNKIFCPGICDNSMGIISLLYLLKYIKENKIQLKKNIIFLFNVGEEGLGNLRGIKYFIDHLKKHNIRAHIVVEGYKLGRLTTRVAGSHRVKIIVTTRGGHSWRDYGRANAIVLATRIIQEISSLEFLDSPKTTFNVGTINGGRSINSIPDYCEFSLEFRSTSQKELDAKKRELKAILSNIRDAKISTEVLGDRPTGKMNSYKLIRLIKEIHKKLNIKTIEDIGSTDSNYPISKGLPSLTIGITNAKHIHSQKEFLYKRPIKKGIEQLIHIFNSLNNQNV